MRTWYAKNKSKHIKFIKESNGKRLQKIKDTIQKVKQIKGCQHCPENDPRCLDFHHRDPKTKSFCVSEGLARYSHAKILAEIAKCDVICANCHRKLHINE